MVTTARTPSPNCTLTRGQHDRLVGHAPRMIRWASDRERPFLIGLQARVKRRPDYWMSQREAAWLSDLVQRFLADTLRDGPVERMGGPVEPGDEVNRPHPPGEATGHPAGESDAVSGYPKTEEAQP